VAVIAALEFPALEDEGEEEPEKGESEGEQEKPKERNKGVDWDRLNAETPIRGFTVSITGGGKFRKLHRVGTGCSIIPGVHYKVYEHNLEWSELAFDSRCAQCWPEERGRKESSSSWGNTFRGEGREPI